MSGAKRSVSLPEVPTLIEAGVPGYEVNPWSGGTPEQSAQLIRRDSAKWAEVVRRSGAKID